ncbi:MAG: hypothetical protein IJA97_00545 [Clostridia bacterium]|nr:hypothetical protein [Clostridia bacterium]
MANFKMKCPECSHEFTGESTIEYVTCPSCNKQISANKAIKYFQTLNKRQTEKKMVAQGEIYAKVDALVEESKWHVENGNYEKALEISDEALKLTTVDSRVYMARVYAKTKNFTDYEDVTHYSDLKKALDLSPVFEKEKIRAIYAPYYKKANVPKEEMREYENQEATSRLQRVEDLLKDSIPTHFKKQKAKKPTIIIMIALLAVAGVLMALSYALDISLLSLASASILIVTAFILIKFFDDVKKIKTFDAVLDFFDELEKFQLEPSFKLKTSVALEKLAVAQINNESTMKIDGLVRELLSILLESENANVISFISNNKVFKKYIKNEQD